MFRLPCRVLAAVLCASVLPSLAAAGAPPAAPPRQPPNILFIILDDVGVDQLRIFNPLAVTSPWTPNIEAVASKGVKFTRFWTMPECSPSRACFFTGRYPIRTGVTAATLPEDLPQAQLSPYEVALPRVLATAGYSSAMIGKWHMAGPDNNPDGYRTPAVLGWDYYSGNLTGGPPYVDTTLGGQWTGDVDGETPRYSCGFPVGTARGGGWFQGPGNQVRFDDNGGQGYTGKQVVELGGIPALDGAGEFTMTCSPAAGCRPPDFSRFNGYYVWPRVTVDGQSVNRSHERKYMTVAEADGAIAWIKGRAQAPGPARPWMCTLSFSSDHVPYQPPPDSLYPPGAPTDVPDNTVEPEAQRILSNRMIEAMDKEIGRVLVSSGLARQVPGGGIVYTPETTNTMVVIVGDNGSFIPSVKYPYNPVRSKGSVYETGVRTPLIVAGPQVVGQGRTVDALTSCVDLFELFGEMAGVSVRSVVPAEHILDSRPMLAYLKNPTQAPAREFLFTQLGNGLKPPSLHIWPCVLQVGPEYICTDILFTTEQLCHALGGTPYGPELGTQTFNTCCDVKDANLPDYPDLTVVPPRVWAVRNAAYKLVYVERRECDTDFPFELYKLQPRIDPINPLGIDNDADNLLDAPLTAEAAANYQALMDELHRVMDSEPACPGDGNLDKVVDMKDFVGVQSNRGRPSVFDFDRNGTTDEADLQIVRANMGADCRPAAARP